MNRIPRGLGSHPLNQPGLLSQINCSWKNCCIILLPQQKETYSWWLNQPIWKLCSSNWIISPGRDRGELPPRTSPHKSTKRRPRCQIGVHPEQKNVLYIPYQPCMLSLPTFGWFLWFSYILGKHRIVSWMRHGLSWNHIYQWIESSPRFGAS